MRVGEWEGVKKRAFIIQGEKGRQLEGWGGKIHGKFIFGDKMFLAEGTSVIYKNSIFNAVLL